MAGLSGAEAKARVPAIRLSAQPRHGGQQRTRVQGVISPNSDQMPHPNLHETRRDDARSAMGKCLPPKYLTTVDATETLLARRLLNNGHRRDE